MKKCNRTKSVGKQLGNIKTSYQERLTFWGRGCTIHLTQRIAIEIESEIAIGIFLICDLKNQHT